MPRLSIVIPCPRDAECFEATLASVLQNRPDDCEILVVQPRPYNDPYRLAGEVLFLEAPRDCSLVALINTGVRCATGAVVHVLTCDVEVKDGWSDFILSHFRDRSVGSVSPVLLCRDDAGQTATRGVSYGAGGRRHEGAGLRRAGTLTAVRCWAPRYRRVFTGGRRCWKSAASVNRWVRRSPTRTWHWHCAGGISCRS